MRRGTLTTVLYLALLFFAGVAVGAFGLRLYTMNSVSASASPEEFRRRYVAELQSRLKLTNQQIDQLQPILDETRQRHHDLREKHKPEFDAIHDEQVRKIRLMLTDAQQAEYTKLLEEREKQRQLQQPHH
jgi:Spy/CpxP family protein refolding chaperone